MILLLLRIFWRILIFLLGVGALIFIVRTVWPNSDNQAAILGALIFTYGLMAYLVIPNLMRLFHVFSKPDHIPLYVTTGDGWPSDPVNIAILSKDKKHLIKAMRKAGWYMADKTTFKNSLREAWSIIFNQPYPNAPVSTLYLFNRAHDIAFQIPTNQRQSARTRHHVRFWKLKAPRKDHADRGHFDFWSSRLLDWLHRKNEIWIGASTYDFKPIDIRWRTGSITHGVHHEADKERDYIIKTLKDTGSVSRVNTTEPHGKFKFRGQSFRTVFTTDGSIKVVKLK